MGRENWEPQETDGGRGYSREHDAHSGSFWASTRTRAWSRRPGWAAPGMCHQLPSFFQGCIGNVHLSEKGPKAGVWTKGKEGLNPWRNRTFSQTCPLLGERPSGDTNPQGQRESSRTGPYRANPRGVRDRGRGQRDRSPRKPMGPGKFQPPWASLGRFLRQFSYRGQAWLPTTRNRGSGRSPASDFFGGCTWKTQRPK